jgi:hypothetical protein
MGEMAAGAAGPGSGFWADAGVLPGPGVRPGSSLLPGAGILSDEGILPVLPALHGLLTAGGLQRGQVVTTDGWSLLCLALAAGASAAGAWCAAVGLPSLGVRAAIDIGLDPDRLLLVAEPGESWAQVVAALLDGCDIVVLRPPAPPSAQLRRKLEAAARRHGCVLLVAGHWDGAAARLRIAASQWTGIAPGHGRLRARQVHVLAEGRGAGARPRHTWLWLPSPSGAVTPAPDPRAAAPAPPQTAHPQAWPPARPPTALAEAGAALTETGLTEAALTEAARDAALTGTG